MKHIVAPRIQHQVTEAGPPRVKGVLNVVAILEHRPMILNAKLIYRDISRELIHRICTRTVAMLENSRLKDGT